MSDWFSARKHSSYMKLFREIMATSDPKLACLREILLNWPALLEKLHISVFFSPYLKLLGNGYPMLEVSRHPWRVRNGRSPSREPWKAGFEVQVRWKMKLNYCISWDLSGICKIFVTGALFFFFSDVDTFVSLRVVSSWIFFNPAQVGCSQHPMNCLVLLSQVWPMNLSINRMRRTSLNEDTHLSCVYAIWKHISEFGFGTVSSEKRKWCIPFHIYRSIIR